MLLFRYVDKHPRQAVTTPTPLLVCFQTSSFSNYMKMSPKTSSAVQDTAAIDSAHIEQINTTDIEDLKSAQVGDRVDDAVQKYAAMGRVEVDDQTSRRLRHMIDRRVLVIMVFTYLVQALDKGSLSFTSIMGLLTDLKIDNSQVHFGYP